MYKLKSYILHYLLYNTTNTKDTDTLIAIASDKLAVNYMLRTIIQASTTIILVK